MTKRTSTFCKENIDSFTTLQINLCNKKNCEIVGTYLQGAQVGFFYPMKKEVKTLATLSLYDVFYLADFSHSLRNNDQ